MTTVLRGRAAVAAPGRSVRRQRVRDVVWCAPVLVLTAVVLGIGLGRSPQHTDDEGTYVAQAWSVLHDGRLAPYTYWYDHPPVGWMQLAGWFAVTGALHRSPSAVTAGREAMLAAALVTGFLTWVLVRRLGGSRPAASAAGVVLAVSPLAVAFHRQVSLDDVATPWVLLAAVLVTARRRQLGAWTGAAVALAVAVLSKETTLLVAPFLAWAALRQGHPAVRRTAATVAVTVFVLLVAVWPVGAAVKGELFPGDGHVSLLGAVAFQLVGRGDGTTDPDGVSATVRTLASWWSLDPVFVAAGLAAAVLGTAARRTRPYGALVVAHALVAVRPGGWLPVPFVVVLLPFGALLAALVVEDGVRPWLHHDRRYPRGLTATLAAVTATAVLAATATWAPGTVGGVGALTSRDDDRPVRDAERWVDRHAGPDDVVVVDDAMWLDLVRSGRSPGDVVWFHKLDSDSAVRTRTDGGRSVSWVVTTVSMRADLAHLPTVRAALRRAVLERRFGTGGQRVEVWRVRAPAIR